MEGTIRSKILINNASREQNTLSKYACESKKGIRRNPSREKIRDEKNIRQIFSHDADKIMHTRGYSRYIDKTQVFCLFENDHITRRILHVQLVSKIGRVIGRCLQLNEDLIEAIALGHDLGHAPYGHDGERILHTICRDNDIGCFCHNAQSVRLLMQLENKGKGLNISLQVLDGILAHRGELPLVKKYEPIHDKSWDLFDEEYRKCLEVEDYSKKIVPMTLEGCVVKISDIIAYIGRDIEDAITLKVIKRKDIPPEIKRVLGSRNDQIIDALVSDLVGNSYDKPYLSLSDKVFKALDDLLKFNVEHINRNPAINTEFLKIENIYKQLFRRYCRELADNSKDSFTYAFTKDMEDSYLANNDDRRIIVDYLAGMTDDFFNNQYQQLFVPQSYGYSL